jgi:hypothetical protein
MSVGDQIKMVVDATSKTTGTASLENLTTGKKVTHKFTSTPSTLCETNAEWIVEGEKGVPRATSDQQANFLCPDFESGGQLVPFANFDTVTFTDASAKGSSGTITPAGSTIIDIRDPNTQQVLTDCGVSGGDVTCRYTGS